MHRRLKPAEIGDGVRPDLTSIESGGIGNRVLEHGNEVLGRAAAFFASETLPKRRTRLARDRAADGIPVAVALRVLRLSKQAFSTWNSHSIPDRDRDDAHLITTMMTIRHSGRASRSRSHVFVDPLTAHGVRGTMDRVDACGDNACDGVDLFAPP